MKFRVTFMRALGIGLVAAFVITVACIVIAFVTRAQLSVPGVVEISPAGAGTAPSTEFFFNPLATLLLALVITVAVWAAGQVPARRQQ